MDAKKFLAAIALTFSVAESSGAMELCTELPQSTEAPQSRLQRRFPFLFESINSDNDVEEIHSKKDSFLDKIDRIDNIQCE